MLKLRPYKPGDASHIAGWCKDERALRMWSSDRFGDFPVAAEDINHKYLDCNGDCAEPDNFYPFTAFDDRGVAGHLIMRYTGGSHSTIRFGFVIVDDSRRGEGLGSGMLRLALKYAFDILGAEKVTLGVFDNNPAAEHCYRAVGFRDVDTGERETCQVCGELWSIMELMLTRREYYE